MAIQTEPTRIQIPFADSGTKNVIPDTNSTPSASQAASWTDGFPAQCSLPLSAGGIPPARADFNGIFNTLSQSARFTQEGGVWAWDATVDYAANRVVLGPDGLLYWSVAQSGPNIGGTQDPTTDNGTYWQLMPMDDADVVHKTGDETIGGNKTFSNSVYIAGTSSKTFSVRRDDLDLSVPPSVSGYVGGLSCKDANDSNMFLVTEYYDSGLCEINVSLHPFSASTLSIGIACRYQYSTTNIAVIPLGNDNSTNLGYSGRRWKQLYAGTTTIATSDERLKSSTAPIPDVVLDAWGDVHWMQFQFNDAIAEKGAEAARLHSGLVAQRIDEAFKAHGLDASRYGLFCYDEWEEEPERIDDNGNVVQEALPAGNRYSLRYEEALCMEAAYQRRRADRAEARLVALEERLAAIEAKLSS